MSCQNLRKKPKTKHPRNHQQPGVSSMPAVEAQLTCSFLEFLERRFTEQHLVVRGERAHRLFGDAQLASTQCFFTTLLSFQHSFTTHSLQRFFSTRLSTLLCDASLHHFLTPLTCNTSLQDFFTTSLQRILSTILFHTFWTTRLCNTSLQRASSALLSNALFSTLLRNKFLQHV